MILHPQLQEQDPESTMVLLLCGRERLLQRLVPNQYSTGLLWSSANEWTALLRTHSQVGGQSLPRVLTVRQSA